MTYSEDGVEPDLSDCRASVRVGVDPPNDSHSGAGILFRADAESGSYYSFLLRAGNEVSLAITQHGRLRFLWSQEIRPAGMDELVKLEVEGKPDRMLFSVNNRVLKEEKNPALRSGVPGWVALSIGTFSYDDFTLYQRLS